MPMLGPHSALPFLSLLTAHFMPSSGLFLPFVPTSCTNPKVKHCAGHAEGAESGGLLTSMHTLSPAQYDPALKEAAD